MKNRIIQALPPRELRVVERYLNVVTFQSGMVLDPSDTARNLYFPNDAVVSYLSGTVEGETIEVAIVGSEGAIGIASLSTAMSAFRASVQIPGTSYRLRRPLLEKELGNCNGLQDLLYRYKNAFLIQITQTAVCNRFHSIEQRLCRWLLMATDRTNRAELALTQESISHILGTRRASVTLVIGKLQRAGLIKSHRGMVAIADRERLKGIVCECYGIITAAYEGTFE